MIWDERVFKKHEKILGITPYPPSSFHREVLIGGLHVFVDLNTFMEMRSFWVELEDLHGLCSPNWEDFSIIRNLDESSNSLRLTTSMRRFDEIIRELSLFTSL